MLEVVFKQNCKIHLSFTQLMGQHLMRAYWAGGHPGSDTGVTVPRAESSFHCFSLAWGVSALLHAETLL